MKATGVFVRLMKHFNDANVMMWEYCVFSNRIFSIHNAFNVMSLFSKLKNALVKILSRDNNSDEQSWEILPPSSVPTATALGTFKNVSPLSSTKKDTVHSTILLISLGPNTYYSVQIF